MTSIPFLLFFTLPLFRIGENVDSGPHGESKKNTLLLNGGKDADVHFLVGSTVWNKEKISAHKEILSAASDVFQRMFAYDASNGAISAGQVIEVPDVEPGPFRVMLNFIYWHGHDLDELNQYNAEALLFAAHKYNIAGLIKACLNCILDAKGVVTALGHAQYYDVKHEKLENYEFWKVEEVEDNLEFGRYGLVTVKDAKRNFSTGVAITASQPLLIKERGIVYYELKINNPCRIQLGIGQKSTPMSTFYHFNYTHTLLPGDTSIGDVIGFAVKFSTQELIITKNGRFSTKSVLGRILNLNNNVLDMALAIKLYGEGCSVQLGRVETTDDESNFPIL